METFDPLLSIGLVEDLSHLVMFVTDGDPILFHVTTVRHLITIGDVVSVYCLSITEGAVA